MLPLTPRSNTTRTNTPISDSSSPTTENDSTLFPRDAVSKIETAYLAYKARANNNATVGIRALLHKHGNLVTDIKTLNNDDVIVIHKRPDEDTRVRHALIAIIEDVISDDHVVTIYEVATLPRDSADAIKLADMSARDYGDMGIYKGILMCTTRKLQFEADVESLFKLNISRDQLDSHVKSVVDNLKSKRDPVFYGSTYDCNNFVYDVLRKV